jgi:flagellar biosynthesis/type III secretory pathway protein FliH
LIFILKERKMERKKEGRKEGRKEGKKEGKEGGREKGRWTEGKGEKQQIRCVNSYEGNSRT